MAGTYGVSETTGSELSQLVAGDFHAMKKVTIASGEGSISRGTVLARDASSDKYVALDKEAAAADENIGSGDGTTKTFSATLANTPVIPRTVSVEATVGGSPVIATDDGYGKLTGSGVSGTINYGTGEVSLTYQTAPDNATNILADYNYGDASDKHKAAAILAEDADASAADAEAQVYLVGEYRLADLVWPDGITNANKTRAIEQLADRGIIVK